jgi:hypothetical protein
LAKKQKKAEQEKAEQKKNDDDDERKRSAIETSQEPSPAVGKDLSQSDQVPATVIAGAATSTANVENMAIEISKEQLLIEEDQKKESSSDTTEKPASVSNELSETTQFYDNIQQTVNVDTVSVSHATDAVTGDSIAAGEFSQSPTIDKTATEIDKSAAEGEASTVGEQ